ncbi:GtrA family protein [Nocardia sp. NPDC050413]|uniref:GtrA family protein n=1 Tax=Nocardia sp. NPDC050413 TaxID=3155784 RepID=UPI0034026B4F
MTTEAAPADGVLATPGPLLRIVKRQELAFAIVGGFNTLLGMVLVVCWLQVLGDDRPSLSMVATYAVSTVVAFVLHRTLVFRVSGRILRDFVAFCGVNAGALVLNMVLVELGVNVFGLPAEPVSVASMGLVAVLSFFGHRYISFRRAR